MRRLIFRLNILIVLLGVSSNAWGWLNTGHRIVAMIVWTDLTPATQAKVTQILKQHPRFVKDLLADKPAEMPDEGVDRYAFVTAATWPDTIRSFGHPMHAGYNHPNWHYIDIPYIINGQPIPATHPASEETGPHDVVEALAKNVADVKDPHISAADRAIALCWVLHLCGDIHQPLHACTMYSPQFPNSDQGGNAFLVLRDPPFPDSKMNLHLIWDSLPGDFDNRDLESYIADGLQKDPRFSRTRLKDLLAVKDFAAWANESHELAVKVAYLDGQLNGLKAHAAEDHDKPIPGLPHGYLNNAEAVADHCLVLAGYRTADLLNSIFDGK